MRAFTNATWYRYSQLHGPTSVPNEVPFSPPNDNKGKHTSSFSAFFLSGLFNVRAAVFIFLVSMMSSLEFATWASLESSNSVDMAVVDEAKACREQTYLSLPAVSSARPDSGDSAAWCLTWPHARPTASVHCRRSTARIAGQAQRNMFNGRSSHKVSKVFPTLIIFQVWLQLKW
jgi:hypothetical protein